MAHYTEAQMFEAFDRLVRIYLESYPNDKESLLRFMRWAHSQYGYYYGKS